MNRKISIALLTVISGFTSVAVVTGTVAWFESRALLKSNDSDITGASEGAYYESGDGLTQESAFVISKPRHLYNLSWLQFLGFYDKTEEKGKQYYFVLKNDLDMSGWTIPPIGTEENPFIGNFDGKGFTVSNLNVSNDYSEYNKHPSKATSTYFNEHTPNIVGLFGVVGDIDNKYTNNDGTTKDGLVYNSEINEIKNLGILSATIKSSATNTLVGIAAGYVNATLENVAVNNSNLYTKVSASAITSITSNVSDYSLIGFATEDFKNQVKLRSQDADIPTLDNPNTEQGGDNWGGSINMFDMYSYLRTLSNSATAYSFATKETRTIDESGNVTSEVTQRATNSNYASNWREYYRYEGSRVVENEKEYASVTFARSSDYSSFSSYNDNDDQYICLYGGVSNKRGTTGSGTNATNQVTTVSSSQAGNFKISSNGTNYLTRNNNGNVTNSTSQSTSNNWSWSGKYLKNGSGSYYLNISNGSLTTSGTQTTQWTYNSEKKSLYATSGGTTYYLSLSGTNWTLVSTGYYTIHDDTAGGYVNYGSSYYLADISNSATTQWSYGQKSSDAGYGYYTPSNYYIGYFSDSYAAQCYSDTKYCAHLESGATTGTGKLVAENGSTKYYIYYTGSGSAYFTSATNDSSRGDTFTIKYINPSEGNFDINLGTITTTSENAVYDTYPTYFPLTRDKDDQGNYTGSGKPDEKNTGYVISGANLTDSTQGPYGDLRVSRFATKNISVSLSGDTTYSASKLEIVTRTTALDEEGNYVDSGWTRISDDYNKNNTISNTLSSTFPDKKNYKSELQLNKYKASRSQLDTTLSTGGGNIYGLHFMDAAISTSRLVTAPNVIVLDGKTLDGEGKAIGSEYSNYQLPQDSIDFNLKDQGFINFFAGTYFSNNDTFFSLHTITRNANNEITSINEIKQIYAPASGDPSNDNPYVYSYNGTKPSGAGDMIFDVSWITSPSIVEDAVYYFEIPVNAGEFALGSVSGKNGAYLMYLDIGAGIDNYKDITTVENIEEVAKSSYYPKGIDFLEFTSGSSRSAVTGGDSATIKVAGSTNANQTLAFVYSGTNLTVSTTGSAPPVSLSFLADGQTAQSKIGDAAATSLGFSPPVLYNMTDHREILESYNVFTTTVTRTYTETFTITNGSNGIKIQLPKPVVSTGFVIDDAISYGVISGPATVTATEGLVTLTGSGEVVISLTYSEKKEDVEQWDTVSTAITDTTEGTIFKYHFNDYDDPNLVTRYVYDAQSHTYMLYVTATNSTILYIDSVPEEDGYTVIVIINGDDANKVTLTSTSETTEIPITIS